MRAFKAAIFAATLAGGALLSMGQTRIIPSLWSAAFMRVGDGSASAPSYSFLSDTTRGIWSAGSGGLILSGGTSNIIEQRNGTNAQIFRVYNTYANSGTDYERITLGWSGSRVQFGADNGGTGSLRAIDIYGNTLSFYPSGIGSNTGRWNFTGAGAWLPQVDNTGTIGNGSGTLNRPTSVFLAGPAVTAPTQAAGGTVVDAGSVRDLTYKITITPTTAGDCNTAFKAAALTADCTVLTLQAGQKVMDVYADVTAGFTCSGTCTGTKTMTFGKTAGGAEYLVSFSVTATTTKGLADADLGTSINRANAIQGGDLPSWSATTALIARFTSGTGNWGTGSATNVNAGSVTFYVTTRQVK